MATTHYDIDFYLHPALAYGTFDANGDGVLQGLYRLVGSKTDQVGVSYSDAIGDQTFARPTWYADVTPASPGAMRGYAINSVSQCFCVF
jgi:hypothetical protein